MIEREVEVEDVKFRLIQRVGKLRESGDESEKDENEEKMIWKETTESGEIRVLVYDYKICNGCGICVFACPVNAIELGPIHDIAIGLEMPAITLDHTKCAYCGICFVVCPFNAFEFYINNREVEKNELPVFPSVFTKINDRCVNCTLCYKVCPTKAISRKIKMRRGDIKERNEDVVGKVSVDRDKCNLCGVCGEFCNVFKLIEKEITPENINPYSDLLIDESECDYCKLCEDVCPENAIEVRGKRIEFEVREVAEVTVNGERCSNCAYCVKICPYDAIETTKPFDGSLFLYEFRMYRCDPIGCGACIRICKHNRVWYVSKDRGRVYFNSDFCNFCGACENSCPYDLIVVERESGNYHIRSDEPWKNSWKDAVERIIKKERVREPERRFHIEKIIFEEEEEILIDKRERRDVETEEEISKIEQVLKIPRYRRAIERGELDREGLNKLIRGE